MKNNILNFLFLFSFFCFSLSITAEGDLPLYLAIEVVNDEDKTKVLDFIDSSIGHLKDRYKDSMDFVISDLKKPHWHVTTLYIGNNASKLETDYYKSFHDEMQFRVPLQTFLYVPGKIITAPVFFDSFPILIENKHPHITLMTGKWKAVNSNDLLTALYDRGSPIHEAHYVGVFENPKTKIVMKVPGMKILGEKVDVYIVKVPADEKELIGESVRLYH